MIVVGHRRHEVAEVFIRVLLKCGRSLEGLELLEDAASNGLLPAEASDSAVLIEFGQGEDERYLVTDLYDALYHVDKDRDRIVAAKDTISATSRRLLEERKSYQGVGTNENLRSFKLFLLHFNEIRKDGLISFLTPSEATARCARLESNPNEVNDCSFEELLIFSILASSRLWQEYTFAHRKAHMLTRRWFALLFKHFFKPKDDLLWGEGAAPYKAADLMKEVSSECDEEKDGLFREWMRSACDWPALSLWTNSLEEDHRLWWSVRLPRWVFDPTLSVGFKTARTSSPFQNCRRVSFNINECSDVGIPDAQLCPYIFRTSHCLIDFSHSMSRHRLMTILSHVRRTDRHPVWCLMYMSIRQRHTAEAVAILEHFYPRGQSDLTWKEWGEKFMLPGQRSLFGVESKDSKELWSKHNWTLRYRLEDKAHCDLANIDSYRSIEHNSAGLMHLAASLCRTPNKYRNLAGLEDVPGDDRHRLMADRNLCHGVAVMKILSERYGSSTALLDRDGLNPFFYASVSGCTQCMEWLANNGCPTDTFDIQRRSAFYCAACVGELKSCQWIVANGFDFKTDRSVLDRTALCKATWGDFEDVVRFLLSLDVPPCPLDSKNRTPLHTAVWGNSGGRSGSKVVGAESAEESIGCARALLEVEEGRKALFMYDIDGCAPIHIAASTNAYRCIELLVEFGTHIDMPSRTRLRWTALMCAAYRGHMKALQEFVRLGARLDPVDRHGRNCYAYAIKGGNAEVLQFLLAQPNRPFQGWQWVVELLHFAAIESQTALVEILLDELKLIAPVDLDMWEITQVSCEGYVDSDIHPLDSERDERSVKLSPMHSAFFGQKIVPLSRTLFRSLPFPPFQVYEPDESEEPPPDGSLAAAGISSFLAFDFESHKLRWKRRKVMAILDNRLTLVTSAAMLSTINVFTTFYNSNLEKLKPRNLGSYQESYSELLTLLTQGLVQDLKRKGDQNAGMMPRTGSDAAHKGSSCDIIVGRFGIQQLEEGVKIRIVDSGPLYSHELQKLSRNLFPPTSFICQSLRLVISSLLTVAGSKLRVRNLVLRQLVAYASALNTFSPTESKTPNYIALLKIDWPPLTDLEEDNFRDLKEGLPLALTVPVIARAVGASDEAHIHPLLEAVLTNNEASFQVCQGILAQQSTGIKHEWSTIRLSEDETYDLSIPWQRKAREACLQKRCLPDMLRENLPLHLINVAACLGSRLASDVRRVCVAEDFEWRQAGEAAHFLGHIDAAAAFGYTTDHPLQLQQLYWQWPRALCGKRSWELSEMERDFPRYFNSLEDMEDWLKAAIDFESKPWQIDDRQKVSTYVSDSAGFEKCVDRLETLLRSEPNASPWERFFENVLGIDLEFHVTPAPDGCEMPLTAPAVEPLVADELNEEEARAVTCLVQLAARGEVFILDPFAIYTEMVQCDRLRGLLMDRNIVKVVHSGNMDLRRLCEDFDYRLVNVLDTYRMTETLRSNLGASGEVIRANASATITARVSEPERFVRAQHERWRTLVGMSQGDGRYASLAGLCRILRPGLEMDKTFQRRDWRMRPLPTAMVEYAGQDAAVLPHLAARLLYDLATLCVATETLVPYEQMLRSCSKLVEVAEGNSRRLIADKAIPHPKMRSLRVTSSYMTPSPAST